MQKYRKWSHTKYYIKYYIVWVIKYRKPVLLGLVAERCSEILRQVCKEEEVEIIKSQVSNIYIYILLSVTPTLSVSKLV